MTYKTRGIILRTVKYGETSLIITVYTEKFGIQTYLVHSVRTSKKSRNTAALFQPANILDLDVYHQEQKSIQRIKETSPAYIYNKISGLVLYNCIALFMVEFLHKSIKQPEQNEALYGFCEESLLELDRAHEQVAANMPLFFSLHLAELLGFQLNATGNKNRLFYLDLREGDFSETQPPHPDFFEPIHAAIITDLLTVRVPAELEQIKLNKSIRRYLLLKIQDYYNLHIHGFGVLKTLQVLQEIL